MALKTPIVIACELCGVAVEARSNTRRFCDACGDARERESMRIRNNAAYHAKRNGTFTPAQKQRADVLQSGADLNAPTRLNMAAWYAQTDPALLWILRLAFPFSHVYSKNHRYFRNRAALRPEVRAAQDEMILRIREGLTQMDRRVVKARLWLDIFVQKPKHVGDAVNVVDTLCDALTEATGLDDRWYSIRRLDWQIVKEAPMIYLGIGQDTLDDHQVCSSCGRVLLYAAFRPHKGNPGGIDRICRECYVPGSRK